MKKYLVGALIALSLAAPVVAKKKGPVFVEAAAVKDQPAVTLDKAKAYVLVRSDGQTPLYLMKVPTAADQATYDQLRADGLAKARTKYAKKLKEYEAAKASAANGTPGTIPDKPIEPTEANFEFTPFPLLAGVGIGPLYRFAKGDASMSTYLEEVTPGDYRIYGPLSVAANGAAFGTCFCMGSVSFTARTGEIVDLGLIKVRNALPRRPEGDSSAPTLPEAFFAPANGTAPGDPRLTALPIVAAKFRPVGKLPNYFGLTLARIPAIPGVMRYDRDRIVDLSQAN